MPSSRKAKKKMLYLLSETSPKKIYELGSGWGGLAKKIAKSFPESTVTAFEFSLIPFLWSKMHSFGMKNLQIYRKDFLKEDLQNVDTIVCYLYPRGMELIQKKLTGKHTVISNTFALPAIQPTKTVYLNDLSITPIYRYDLGTSEAP